MPLSKPLILEQLGLITAPNKLGQYADGACLVSFGVLHSGAGSCETAPAYDIYNTIAPPDGFTLTNVEVIPCPTGWTLVLAEQNDGNWVFNWVDPDDDPSGWEIAAHAYAPVTGAKFVIDGRVNWCITRDRVFVTTDKGPMVFDYLAPTSAAERKPRLAGMFAPAIATAPLAGADGGALHTDEGDPGSDTDRQNQAHTVMVVTRHFPDCYEVTGPPSAAAQTYSSGTNVNITNTVYNRPGHPQLEPGDMVEVYRTFQTPRPRNEGAPEDYDQGTSTTADYFMSSVFTIPDGAPQASYSWTEATGDLSLGEALYTNQGVVGASAQKRPPPIARVIEEFRGYTFYFDITEPPARVARAAGGMGQLTDTWSQTWGIGDRSGTPDTVEINGVSFDLHQADDLASQVLSNVDDLARVNPDTPGEWTQPATGFAFRFDYAGFGDFTIRASNGGNYNPPLPTLSETAELIERPRRKNGMMWTENGQPEACVAAGLVGKGQVYGACATALAMVIWTEFGIYRMSGTGGSSSAGFDWALDQIDTQVLLRGPKAYCKLGNLVFCASNNGAVVIDEGGQVREISTASLGNVGRAKWSETDNTRVVPDETTGDVYFCFDGDQYPYVYSTRWNKWSRVEATPDPVVSAFGNLQREMLYATISSNNVRLFRKSPTNFQRSIVRFQPVFDGDPSTNKRWTEVEWYFKGDAVGAPVKFLCNEMEGMERELDPHDGASAIPSFLQSGIADADLQSDASEFSLAQTWMEVPDDAPAVSNSLSVGFVTPAGTQKYTFYGCSIVCCHSRSTIVRGRGRDAA